MATEFTLGVSFLTAFLRLCWRPLGLVKLFDKPRSRSIDSPLKGLRTPNSEDFCSVSPTGEEGLFGAVAVVFYSLSTLSNGLLQGIDRLKVPVINAAISIVAHVIVLILLMLIFRLNIHAVVLANTFFALLMCFMNSMALKKYSGFKQEIKKTFIIPAISSLIMGVISYIVYFILYKACHIEIIAFILAAIIAVISYAVALLLLKGLTEDELRHFPKGTLIIKVAKKCHLL